MEDFEAKPLCGVVGKISYSVYRGNNKWNFTNFEPKLGLLILEEKYIKAFFDLAFLMTVGGTTLRDKRVTYIDNEYSICKFSIEGKHTGQNV